VPYWITTRFKYVIHSIFVEVAKSLAGVGSYSMTVAQGLGEGAQLEDLRSGQMREGLRLCFLRWNLFHRLSSCWPCSSCAIAEACALSYHGSGKCPAPFLNSKISFEADLRTSCKVKLIGKPDQEQGFKTERGGMKRASLLCE